MRQAFIQALTELADHDASIVLLTGDLGYTVLEPFAERFPERFFNVGVAEQNMVGLATGLAASGFRPYVYSIATFASMRPYEFFRNGPVLHQVPVHLVGVGGGFDYGHNGATHFALEDVGIMRLQPQLTVVAPADAAQTATAMAATAHTAGPVYLRLGKGTGPIEGLDGRFRLGHLELLGTGDDVAILTYGGITAEAVIAAELLRDQGIGVTVAVAGCIAPIPSDDIASLLRGVRLAVTLEAHYSIGGLGSLVAEVASGLGLRCPVVRCGVTTVPTGATGDQGYLHEKYRLTGRHVADASIDALGLIR
ncbi:MAG: 1-deoxy-D-xylulose-5-phosphate synthase [Actinomycetota bacterium]|nr:1-deoxy-D-xylulose-5-phosphate synthase [Actinomycetota bacterium]